MTRSEMIHALAARLSIGALVLAAACDRPAPPARKRLLAKIRGDAVTVIVADSRAIAHPRIRGVLDVVASHWPTSMGCVVEAAFGAEQVALSVDASGNVTAIVATSSDPRCAALSQREPGLWIATVGAGPAAATTSVLDDERFARARPYLETAPIAGVWFGPGHVLATAQPDPLEAWLAIDVPGRAQAVEQMITDQVARMQRDPSTAAVASKLRTSRAGDAQVVVRLDGPVDGELAVAARTMLAWAEERTRPAAARFACPSPVAEITCSDGTSFGVGSLPTDLSPIITAGRPSPVVTNGFVTGLRLEAAVERLGLDAGDVVIAMAGRLVTSRAMLADRIAHARGRTTLTIRRGTTEKLLEFVER